MIKSSSRLFCAVLTSPTVTPFKKLKAKIAKEKKAERHLREAQAAFVQQPITYSAPEFDKFGVKYNADGSGSSKHKAGFRASSSSSYKPPTWFHSYSTENASSRSTKQSRRSCKFIDNSAVEEDSDGKSVASEASSVASKESGTNWLDYPDVPRVSSTAAEDSGPNWLDYPEDNPVIESVNKLRQKLLTNFSCTNCPLKNFSSQAQLYEHLLSSKCVNRGYNKHHNKSFRCRACRKKCGNFKNLQRHERACKKTLSSDIRK